MAIYEEEHEPNPEVNILCVSIGELLENYGYSQNIEIEDIQTNNINQNSEICFTYSEEKE